MQLPTPDDVAAAGRRLTGHVVHTPMLRNAMLDSLTGGTILIKPECLQRTGSFKFRGATNAMMMMDDAQRRAGVVAHSSGNHGQAIACAAAAAGSRATVYMPADAPLVKIESTRRWGAEIIPFDRATADRAGLAAGYAASTGATLVPPFDHAGVIAGQGTLALELAEDARIAGFTMDALLICTGGGGMIAGCALAMEAASPGTAVHAIEPEGSDDTIRSLAAGARQSNAPGGSTLCDALLSSMPGELTFAINRTRVAGGVAVTDSEVMAAIRFAFMHLKLVVEPGGAVCLAALLAGKFNAKHQVVGLVLSGGNVDAPVFAKALAA